MLDLRLAPSWTGGCLDAGWPDRRDADPCRVGTEVGPVCGIAPTMPVRLILLDLGDGRTMAIGIFDLGPSEPAQFDEQVAEAMPVIESFEFHPPTP